MVTQILYNHSNNENETYRAEVSFISADEWKLELSLLLNEVLSDGGYVSQDVKSSSSPAAQAYAKIKAVYPLTDDELTKSTPDSLMAMPAVKDVLGVTKFLRARQPEEFYHQLRAYLDSGEKARGPSRQLSVRPMEFWPLIKEVKIFTKADILSTGAVIVDLPGIHDSNAARAAVAQNFMTRCTGRSYECHLLSVLTTFPSFLDCFSSQSCFG